MSPAAADPKRTHALVVGIERYRAGPSWNLKGPATDARLFAKWLRDRGVPEGQIALHVAVEEASPGRKEILEALDLLQGKEGDLLILFWGGHGLLGTDDCRKLFYPDATLDNKQNLDLDDLLKSMRSTYFAGFSSQICIVDACANYVEDLQHAYKLPQEKLPSGDRRVPEPEQFVLLAGRAGEVAKNLGTEGRGQFSKVLLEELAGDADWPPDMAALQTRIDQRFEELRQQGKSSQTPIYRWHREWAGSEELRPDVQALKAAYAERFARVHRNDRAEVETAAEGLLSILDLKALYLQSLPSRSSIDPKARTLAEILLDLAELPPQTGGAFPEPLLEFVERLALKVEAVEPAVAARLRSWVDRKAPELDLKPAVVEGFRSGLRGEIQAPGANAHILLEIKPDLHEPQKFLLRAWSCSEPFSAESCQPIDVPPEDPDPLPRSLQEVQEILIPFFEDLPGYVPEGADITVELFLPRQLLGWDVDQWLIQVGRARKTPVGIQHRIHVRWLDRAKYKTGERHWERKWNSFRAKNLRVEDSILWIERHDQYDLESLYVDVKDQTDILGLAFTPPEIPETEDLLETALEAGLPIAFWLRRCGDDPQAAKQDILTALGGNRSAGSLPEAVRAARSQAYKTKEENHVGHHLTLLWDDAGRKRPGPKKPLTSPRLEGGRP